MTWSELTLRRQALVALMDARYPTLLEHCAPTTVHFWLTNRDYTVVEIADILGGQPERPSVGADVKGGGAW